MKDWLGQEYGVGDKVVYAAMSGRSVTMVLAEVVDMYKVFRNEDFEWQRIGMGEEAPMHTVWQRGEQVEERRETQLRVSLQPLGSSRWEQHSNRTRYIDSRTSKGIDPYRGKNHGVGGYWENSKTQERVDDDDAREDPRIGYRRYWDTSDVPEGWHHVKWSFAPHVQEVKEGKPKPVTLTVTENITKWTGVTP